MRKIMELVLVLVLSWGLTGCFQIDQVVTLLPDGSGTVEETFMISRKMAESMSALSGGMSEQQPAAEGAGKAVQKEQSFFKDEEIRKRAESYGPDTRLVTVERVANSTFEGYKAVYSFKNINTLHIDQSNPGMPKQAAEGEQAPQGTVFVFTPGKTATLVVKQQHKAAASDGNAAPEAAALAGQAGPEELALMRQMFDGMRMSVKLIIKGGVIETNATHRSGSAITLAEIDFGKILDKPELLAKMAAVPPGDQAAAREMVKTFPGMKIDMNDELRVSFK